MSPSDAKSQIIKTSTTTHAHHLRDLEKTFRGYHTHRQVGTTIARIEALEAGAFALEHHDALVAALKAIVGPANETIDGVGYRYSFDYNSPIGLQARRALQSLEGKPTE